MRRTIVAVATMEWRSAVRDRRALLSALIYPLVGPILVGLMFTGMARTLGADSVPSLTIEGAEHAPGLMAWLRDKGLTLHAAPQDARTRVQRGDLDVLVVIPPGFREHFSQGKAADVQLIADFARPSAMADVRRAQALFQGYGASIASFRLLARGVHPGIMHPLKVEEVDLATPQKHSAKLLTVVPIFVIMACFVGGMQVAIDTTAGERERGSLEALLLNPVSRAHLALGKWLITTTFSLMSALLTLGLSVVSLTLAPLEEIGLRSGLSVTQVLLVAALVLPLAPLASAAQLFVATFARSFKEAQTWLSLLLFMPMIPGVVASVMPIQPTTWMYAIPSLGQQLLITDALGGQPISAWSICLAATVSLTCADAAVWATGRMLDRENIIFAGG